MSIHQFIPHNRTTINWTSGTSTEIFIYPSTASFAERNFVFRISTATVEAEESIFTFFEGITRHLMILKGELELIHEDRYTKQLKPFEQDIFSGEWSTRSKGRVTDFNLMLKDGAKGSLTPHKIEHDGNVSFIAKTDFYFIYLASGTIILHDDNTVKTGDLLWIGKGEELTMQAQESSRLIEIEVTTV